MRSEEKASRAARRVAELQRQLDAVHLIAIELGRVTEVDGIVRRSLEVALEVVDAQAGSILLHDPSTDKLIFRYVVGGGGDQLVGTALDVGRGIAGRAFREARTMVTDQASLDPDHATEIEEKTKYVTTNMVTVPLKTGDGQPIGVMQVLNKKDGRFDEDDVAVLEILAHQIASRLENARLQQEARLAEVAKYVGHVCHDLKNLMTPLQTGAQTLNEIVAADAQQLDEVLQSGKLAEDVEEPVAAVAEDLRSLVPEIVQMMLEGSLVTQQRMAEIANAVKGMTVQPVFEETDVVEIAERVVHLLSMQADGLGVELSVQKECEIPLAVVDGRQLYNALYNLVFNAIEACQGGGTVTVAISARPGGDFPEGNYLKIQVSDTGKGMPEHVRKKLFTDEAITTKSTGTGLGTRIVKNVVDAHGGTIAVDSREGEGTTITIKLPLRR